MAPPPQPWQSFTGRGLAADARPPFEALEPAINDPVTDFDVVAGKPGAASDRIRFGVGAVRDQPSCAVDPPPRVLIFALGLGGEP